MQPWNYFTSLSLRGQKLDKKQLLEIANDRRSHYKTPEWEQSFWNFVFAWLNEKKEAINIKTSGSTGRPKSVRVSKQFMVNSALITGKYFNLKQDDRALLCLSSDYIAGKMMVVRAFVLGLDLHVAPQSSNPFNDLPETQNFDFGAMVPMQLHQIIKEGEIENLNRFKTLLVGGAPIGSQLIGSIQNLKTNVFLTYGMTETVSHIAVKSLNGKTKSDWFETLDGIEIETDKKSCLLINAPALNPQKVKTNDIVLINENNPKLFQFVGRHDNVINSGGIKLFPEILERKLSSLISKSDYFFAALPDERLGQKLVLFIESQPLDSSNLFMLKFDMLFRLVKYEIPKDILFIKEFKRTPTRKIKRKATVKAYLQSLDEAN